MANIQDPELSRKRKRSIDSLTHDDYIIGWICSLDIERFAALHMLDERHPSLPELPGDENLYTLGSIAGHNIVIASPNVIGNNPAATVASQIRITFQNLKFLLFVGIGGGVPAKTKNGPICLGHVVVSEPTNGHSGAIQYDHDKARAECFEQTCYLAPPPAVLLNATQKLAVTQNDQKFKATRDNLRRIKTSTQWVLGEKSPRGERYRYPRSGSDNLYRPDYVHKEPGVPCDYSGCEPANRILRDRKYQERVVVHRGTIALGGLFLSNGVLRDTLADKHRVLCFDTAAAGALTNFPCLVIRGISHYCDSHKNNLWDTYAAATAAAYGRQLFSHMLVDEVKRFVTSCESLNNRASRLWQEQDKEMLNWLSSIDHGLQHSNHVGKRQLGSGQWFLNSATYRQWAQESGSTLFCSGEAGAGKTILTSAVIDDLNQRLCIDGSRCVVYIYGGYKCQPEQALKDLLSNLFKQLAQTRLVVPPVLTTLYEKHAPKQTKPSLEEIIKGIRVMAREFSKIFIVVDGLDECPTLNNCRERFLTELCSFQKIAAVSLFFTSRHIIGVENGISIDYNIEIRASDEDIRMYVESHMGRLPGLVSERSDIRDEITGTISRAVDGKFLLAQLFFDSLIDKDTPKSVRNALQSLETGSKSYDTAYENAMQRIQSQPFGQKDRAKQVLSWLSTTQMPMTAFELQQALAIEAGEEKLDQDNIPRIEDLVTCCAGLVTIDPKCKTIRLIHQTAQEYFERSLDTWFPTAELDATRALTTYLSFDAFAEGPCSTPEEFEYRMQEHTLLRYAVLSWPDYARAASACHDIWPFLRKSRNMESFLQAYLLVTKRGDETWAQRQAQCMTPAHVAAMFGLDRVMSALQNDANIDNENASGVTPLYTAVHYRDEAIVKILLATRRVNVDTNAEEDRHRTPLSMVCQNGDAGIARLLLATRKVNLSAKDTVLGFTPLLYAAKNGHVALVKLLLSVGKDDLDINETGNCGETALSLAVEQGHEAVVRMLLSVNTINVDTKDSKGLTPLSRALKNGNEAMVRILVPHITGEL